MNHLPLRIWFLVSIALLLSAGMTRLAWETTVAPSAGYLWVVTLVILAILGLYALFLYLAIKPSLKKLKSLLFRIWATVLISGGVIDSITHFVRFVPSPLAADPLSVVIASLLLAGGISISSLILWVVWVYLKKV